jgi:hypothetical protein
MGPALFSAGSGPPHRPPWTRARRCLLKGCGHWFLPTRPQCRYCSAACQQAARRWRRWRAQQKYRATAHGKCHRQQQARRYRQRLRNRPRSPPTGRPEGKRLPQKGKEVETVARKAGLGLFSFPRSAWERLASDALRHVFGTTACAEHGTQSVPTCVPTRSVGTRGVSPQATRFPCYSLKKFLAVPVIVPVATSCSLQARRISRGVSVVRCAGEPYGVSWTASFAGADAGVAACVGLAGGHARHRGGANDVFLCGQVQSPGDTLPGPPRTRKERVGDLPGPPRFLSRMGKKRTTTNLGARRSSCTRFATTSRRSRCALCP